MMHKQSNKEHSVVVKGRKLSNLPSSTRRHRKKLKKTLILSNKAATNTEVYS